MSVGRLPTARERLILALDLPSAGEARAVAKRVGARVGMLKVGKQLFTAAGPELVRELVDAGQRVFLDLKFHDIPNTVAAAVRSAAALGVSLVNVHALGGRAMIEAAAAACGPSSKLLAVTLLTSHDEPTLSEIGLAGPLPAAVRRLALLARDAGADGVVASPQEIGLIREACGPDFLIVTPGVRPAGADAGDQARLATPGAALRAGADYLVVGRPILQASDPAAAAEAIVRELEAV
ncbi:MAG: orotidine-5'-phosphate decarboxylase [Vicinamibacteria bacterium]